MAELKKVVMQMKLDIDFADEKFKRIESELKLAKEQGDQSEIEIEGLKRKKLTYIQEIEKIEEAYEVKVLRIKAQEEVADDSEKERKVLEQNEYDQNDKIAVLSMKVMQAKKHADEAEQMLKESKERYNLLQEEKHNAQNRLKNDGDKINYLEEELDWRMRSMIRKEWQEQGYIRKEENYEEKIESLEEKLGHTIIRAEDLEQDAKTLRIQLEKMKGRYDGTIFSPCSGGMGGV